MTRRLVLMPVFHQLSARMWSSTVPTVFFLVTLAFAGAQKWTDLDYSFITGLGQRETTNWVVAPVSVSSAMGMLYLGAKGETAKQIGSILSLPEEEEDAKKQLFAGQQALREGTNDVKVTWEMANKILVAKDLPLRKELQTEVSTHFDSEVVNADFSKPAETANSINSWVSNKTHGFIPELISADAITEDTKMVILNAVYFKGLWKSSFDEKRTHKQCFYAKGENCTLVDFMNQKNTFLYGYSPSLKSKILKMPYTNANYSLVIILPDEKSSLAELSASLAEVDLKRTLRGLYESLVQVSIPKFSFEYKRELKQDLINAGVDLPFSNNANLTGFTEGKYPLRVSKVVHKAKIVVNEAGTEAAGATVIGLVPLSLSVPQRDEVFLANKPFFFFVVYNESPLFMGQLNHV